MKIATKWLWRRRMKRAGELIAAKRFVGVLDKEEAPGTFIPCPRDVLVRDVIFWTDRRLFWKNAGSPQ